MGRLKHREKPRLVDRQVLSQEEVPIVELSKLCVPNEAAILEDGESDGCAERADIGEWKGSQVLPGQKQERGEGCWTGMGCRVDRSASAEFCTNEKHCQRNFARKCGWPRTYAALHLCGLRYTKIELLPTLQSVIYVQLKCNTHLSTPLSFAVEQHPRSLQPASSYLPSTPLSSAH